MEYKRGFTLKPDNIDRAGYVTFTDGTNTGLMANQHTCEAYGYRFDRSSGTCTAFRANPQINRAFENKSISATGTGNTIGINTQNGRVIGTDNILAGNNNNTLIVGSNNEIASGINNAIVLGSNGIAKNDGELVIGSGDGIAQSTTLFLNGNTENATPTALFINGDTAVTTIERVADTCYFYSIDINAFRTGGGGAGSVFDRVFFTLHGMINGPNFDETLTVNQKRGTTAGWAAGTAVVGDDMILKVTGASSVALTWTATANFNSMKL